MTGARSLRVKELIKSVEKMHADDINVSLVRRLIVTQFPRWADLPVEPVEHGGWDNKTFHLGAHMAVRLPSAARYAPQVEKEHRWLPKLAPLLPLPIPVPLAKGDPAEGYPWHWSVYRWLEGEVATAGRIADLSEFATTSSPITSAAPDAVLEPGSNYYTNPGLSRTVGFRRELEGVTLEQV